MVDKVAIIRTARRRNEKRSRNGGGDDGQCAYLKSRFIQFCRRRTLMQNGRQRAAGLPACVPRTISRQKDCSCLGRNAGLAVFARAFSALINEVSVTSGGPRSLARSLTPFISWSWSVQSGRYYADSSCVSDFSAGDFPLSAE